MNRRILIATAAALLAHSSESLAGKYQWTVGHFALGKMALVLEKDKEVVSVRSGWVCEVEALSGGGSYEARRTRCTKNGERFAFAVQCDDNRPKDHVQIALGTDEKPDYIEVSCKPH